MATRFRKVQPPMTIQALRLHSVLRCVLGGYIPQVKAGPMTSSQLSRFAAIDDKDGAVQERSAI
jgi:hypothetical protein